MQDNEIIELFFSRNELALQATEAKYGKYCFSIAYNILYNREDADESVSDTYMGAWRSIPPHRPAILSTFLGKLTRRISLNKRRNSARAKRGGGEFTLAIDELSECVASARTTEAELEQKELSECINTFLSTLGQTERDVFVCRYWFLASIAEIGKKFSFSESKIKSMLHRTRQKLKKYLEKEELI